MDFAESFTKPTDSESVVRPSLQAISPFNGEDLQERIGQLSHQRFIRENPRESFLCNTYGGLGYEPDRQDARHKLLLDWRKRRDSNPRFTPAIRLRDGHQGAKCPGPAPPLIAVMTSTRDCSATAVSSFARAWFTYT